MTQNVGNLGWAEVGNSDSSRLSHVYVINQLLVNQAVLLWLIVGSGNGGN